MTSNGDKHIIAISKLSRDKQSRDKLLHEIWFARQEFALRIVAEIVPWDITSVFPRLSLFSKRCISEAFFVNQNDICKK
jgi:hypothetical protein